MTTRGHHGLLFGESPVGPTDPQWANVVLLSDMRSPDGTAFTDAKGHTLTAAGSAAISGGEAVFGGINDFVWAADSNDWALGNEFCIELFGVRFASLPGVSATLLSHWNAFSPQSNQRSWLFSLLASGELRFGLSTGGTSGTAVAYASGSTISPGTYDIRYERWSDAGTLKGNFYVNGSRLGSEHNVPGTPFNANGFLAIATNNPNSSTASNREPLVGGIKAVRLTRAARNPGAASYVVPTLPLPTS